MNQSFHILVRERLSNHVKYDNASLDKPELIIDNLEPGVAYTVAVIAINKKGASPAVYNTVTTNQSSASLLIDQSQLLFQVETLQQPELQLIEEKIPPVTSSMADQELVVGVGVGVGVCITVLVVVGLAVRRSSCGNRRGELRPQIIKYSLTLATTFYK